MDSQIPLSQIRREYGARSLSDSEVTASPVVQFQQWLQESLALEMDDPTAMVLATVDQRGRPDSRVVLLKEINTEGAFVFYTNYLSTKGLHIDQNPHVALNFYWPKLVRQVRIRGVANKISEEHSDAYFASRPISSQWSAIISSQSKPCDKAVLLQRLHDEMTRHPKDEPLKRPKHWGGYAVMPYEVEFWQGRDNRLHDRVHYYQEGGIWHHRLLAP